MVSGCEVYALGEGLEIGVLLAPGLQTVLCELREGRIVEQLGELVHPANEFPAVDHAIDEMEQVHGERRSHDVVVQEVSDIEAD